jgi:hypothetical protein
MNHSPAQLRSVAFGGEMRTRSGAERSVLLIGAGNPLNRGAKESLNRQHGHEIVSEFVEIETG